MAEAFGSFVNSPFTLLEMDSNIDQYFLNDATINEDSQMGFSSSDDFLLPDHQPNDQYHLLDPEFIIGNFSVFPPVGETMVEEKKERKVEVGSYYSNALEGKDPKKDCSKKKRRRKCTEAKEMGKPMEVVHVRARRGQATDNQSLAERVRREKIKDRMKCLQELVPGCYKKMGMTVMLDEIINYVKSLQNQVEFLSMKLSAASSFPGFNVEDLDGLDLPQRHLNVCCL